MIKAILVDDDSGSILTLRQCLENFSETIEIIGTYTNPRQAVISIREKKPDVLFLDIDMKPFMNGILLAKETIGYYGELIFVTGHKKYWQQAFDIHAFQFLLKPIRDDKLSLVISDLKARVMEGWPGQWQQRIGQLVESSEQGIMYFDYIWLTKIESKVLYKVFWNEIVLFEGKQKNEVFIYTENKDIYTKKNTTLKLIMDDIGKLEDKIKRNFYRINSHQILNYEHVISFSPAFKTISLDKDGLKPLAIGDEYPEALAAIKKNMLTNRDKKRRK